MPSPPLAEPRDLVSEAAAFVYTRYKEGSAKDLTYHDYQHAVSFAGAVAKIGGKMDLNENRLRVLLLAGWFHDTGYLSDYGAHVEESVRTAREYLGGQGMPDQQTESVAEMIRFVHSDRRPETPEERILNDANLVHAGSKDFEERSAGLRLEWEHLLDYRFDDTEWAEQQLHFLTNVRYATPYGRKKYEKRRVKNLRKVHQALAGTLNGEQLPAKAKKDREVPTRGIETLFRSAYRTHVNLSAIADSKANIMISINAILLSIIISFVSTRLQTDPWLIVPSAALLITCLVAIVFAILSARPKVTSRSFSLSDVRNNPRSNILFFGNFTNMSPDDFTLGMRELMVDGDMLYDNMINDIYSLGHVLQRKYRLLWISYSAFMAGLVVSVALFAIFFYIA